MESKDIRRLPFEKYMQLMFDVYPILFYSRFEVMDQMFATAGSGYAWKDGTLFDEDASSIQRRIPTGYSPQLNSQGQAERTPSSVECYLSYRERNGEFDREVQDNKERLSSLNENDKEFLENLEFYQALCDIYPTTVEAIKDKERQSLIEDNRSGIFKDSRERPYPLSAYAPMFALSPLEMRLDWARGLHEYLQMRAAYFAVNPKRYALDKEGEWKEPLFSLRQQLNLVLGIKEAFHE